MTPRRSKAVLSPVFHRLALAGTLAASALGVSACGLPASNLDPQQVAGDQGAFCGHIDLIGKVTRLCNVFFEGEDGSAFAVRMDSTGWIFTTARPGLTRISKIDCALYVSRGMAMATTRPNLAFEVPGRGKIGYLGHVQVFEDQLVVKRDFAGAVEEYERRYGRSTPLTPMEAIASGPPAISGAPPRTPYALPPSTYVPPSTVPSPSF